MDTSEPDQFSSEWMIAYQLKHQISGVTAERSLEGSSMSRESDSYMSVSQAIPMNSYPCPSIPMLGSFIRMASNENNTPRKINSPSQSNFPDDFSGMIHSIVPCPSMTPCTNSLKDFIGTRLQKIVLNMPETKDAMVFHHEPRSENSIKNDVKNGSSNDMLPADDPCRTNFNEGSQEKNITSAEASDYLCPSYVGEKKRKKSDQDKEICNQVRTKEKRSRKTSNKHLNARAPCRRANNSHNIAERLRRERISERMRYLQNLVPGCTKVTGKALMLDEIINYVQSLQQQVEFLSMKLAAVHPQQNYTLEQLHLKDLYTCDDTSLETGLPKEILHPHLNHQSQQDFAPIGICTNMIHSSWEQEFKGIIMDTADGTNAQEKW